MELFTRLQPVIGIAFVLLYLVLFILCRNLHRKSMALYTEAFEAQKETIAHLDEQLRQSREVLAHLLNELERFQATPPPTH